LQEASQYEAMLRLVAAHRSELLEPTRRHVAQALQGSGDLRAAENYYIQAGAIASNSGFTLDITYTEPTFYRVDNF
jgi:hypothetical protein